ncbi:MAG: class I SAM-dependent methyltransferase, partial [Thermomicrobiales bacterium]
PVGLDLSPTQLGHARRLMAEAGVDFPLIEASAEAVPLPDASFDIVFCDYGATLFCDPYLYVPEVARLLRPGGLFAFTTLSPISMITMDLAADQQTDRLHNDYFGLHRLDWPGEHNFVLPYGEWLRTFRRHGFVVEDLIEPQAPADATSTYRTPAELAWARRWPMENLWKVRKR